MPADKDRFDKIFALAIDPGAHEGEAQAAFLKLRDLVRENPSLTAPPSPPAPQRTPPKPTESCSQWRLTNLPVFWLEITVSNLSERAYLLGLRSKFVFDFSERPTAVDIRCDGSEDTCRAFDTYLNSIVSWTNKQPADPTKT